MPYKHIAGDNVGLKGWVVSDTVKGTPTGALPNTLASS